MILDKLALYFSYPFVRYALIVGVLISLCSSLLGVTLVLKRFSFIGDGLSHVAFGAVASVLGIGNNMVLVLPVTILSAVGIAVLLCFALTACGNQTGKTTSNTNTVSGVLEQQMSGDETTVTPPVVAETPRPTEEPMEVSAGGVDVDLTQLSSTMVYSEVYNMMTQPEDYLGKLVKMQGTFAVYENEATGQRYFACLIADATACCSQGMEFVLSGNAAYPEDYPELGTEITVTGVFETYEEDGWQYCHLTDAVLG